MSITRDFKLSLVAGRSVPLVINANQYDQDETWRFTLLDENGQKYSPSTGSIIGLKSDGHIIANAGTVTSTGLVIIMETEQMTASPGKNFYELLIDDDTHGTANFIVFVEPRPGADGTPSDSDLAVFQEAIDAAAQIGDASELVDDVAVLKSRMDEFTTLTDGSTTGDAELADIRVGADGTTYPNAGDAVRGQVSDLKNALNENANVISSNIMFVDVQENLYNSSNSKSDGWTTHSANGVEWDSDNYDGYPVIKLTGPWKWSFYKAIPVESGKTYTFEAMINATDASDIRVQFVFNNITTATGTPTATQITTLSSGQWQKITARFTCTQSGTIAPSVTSAVNTVVYVSKLMLVEGTTVFSLKTALENKVNINDFASLGNRVSNTETQISALNHVSGITIFTLGSQSQNPYVAENWNPTIDVDLKAGQEITVEFLGYTGEYLSVCSVGYIDSSNTYHTLASNLSLNDKISIQIQVNITKLYFQFRRTQSEWNVTGAVNFVANETNDIHIYYCEKDGSGDFTSLIEAINEAEKYMDSVLYVGAGIWNIIDELGSEYVESVSGTKRGVYLKNRIHIICSSEAIITCNYAGTRADTILWLSAFNTGEYGFTLENATIESSNCRYAIHDERDTHTDQYVNKYINCRIKHDNSNGGYASCIGGGLGKDGYVVIDGCIFENPHATNTHIVSYHNTWYAGGTGRSTVDVNGCYVKGTNGMRFTWFGASQEITTYLVHGNSFGKAIVYSAENQSMMDEHPEWIVNTELIAWNNEVRTQ